jgi:hypothetical protein
MMSIDIEHIRLAGPASVSRLSVWLGHARVFDPQHEWPFQIFVNGS